MRKFHADGYRLWRLILGNVYCHGTLVLTRYSPWDWKHYGFDVVMTFNIRRLFWKRLHIEFTRWISPFRTPWCFKVYFER